MMRTRALLGVTTLLLASPAFADSLANTPFTGSGAISAGSELTLFNVNLPSADNYTVQDDVANCTADVSVFANASNEIMTSGMTFQGAGQSVEGSGAGFFITIDLLDATYFTLGGTFNGLTGITMELAGASNPFYLSETLSRTPNGFEGSLVDGNGQPLASVMHAGWLEAGQYDVMVEFSVAGFGAGSYNGMGSFEFTLSSIPAPSSLLAMALPGALALRRRR